MFSVIKFRILPVSATQSDQKIFHQVWRFFHGLISARFWSLMRVMYELWNFAKQEQIYFMRYLETELKQNFNKFFVSLNNDCLQNYKLSTCLKWITTFKWYYIDYILIILLKVKKVTFTQSSYLTSCHLRNVKIIRELFLTNKETKPCRYQNKE